MHTIACPEWGTFVTKSNARKRRVLKLLRCWPAARVRNRERLFTSEQVPCYFFGAFISCPF